MITALVSPLRLNRMNINWNLHLSHLCKREGLDVMKSGLLKSGTILLLLFSTAGLTSGADSAIPESMVFVELPAGEFIIGSPMSEDNRDADEGPQCLVELDSFQIMTTPVTQEMWEQVTGTTIVDLYHASRNADDLVGIGPDYPVYLLTWDDCQFFIDLINSMDPDYTYSLPSESQWEYACRAGTTTPYFWESDTSNSEATGYVWYQENSDGSVHPVAEKLPNPWGLYDMGGNVQEWCEDVYAGSYHFHPTDGSVFTGFGDRRVARGGCFEGRLSSTRSANRTRQDDEGRSYTGFRLVRVPRGWTSTVAQDQRRARFDIGPDGVLLDLETGYRWQSGPDTCITLQECIGWLLLSRGNLRLPSRYELMDLYRSVSEFESISPFIDGVFWTWTIEDARCPSSRGAVYREGNEYWQRVDPDSPRYLIAVVADSDHLDDSGRYLVQLPEGMEFVEIPSGGFTMGSPASEQGRQDNEVLRQVQVDAFQMMTTPVTQGMWFDLTGRIPDSGRGVGFNFPLYDGYCYFGLHCAEVMNELDPFHIYRLPTEEEWEYACRAGTSTRFYWGDDPDENEIGQYAWYRGNSEGRTHPVATKLPNDWGLYDMSGNVHEWCIVSTDPEETIDDPAVTSAWSLSSGEEYHVTVRGGACSRSPDLCRSAWRFGLGPYSWSIGFRLVRTPVPSESVVVDGETDFVLEAFGVFRLNGPRLEWCLPSHARMGWSDAVRLVYSLGEGWRVPDTGELMQLSDSYRQLYNVFDTGMVFWADDKSVNGNPSVVNVDDGEVYSHDEARFSAMVLAVRESDGIGVTSSREWLPSIEDARFSRNASGNITDLHTGLVWYLGPDRPGGAGSDYRFLLQLGSLWRLPTLMELRNLHEAGLVWPSNMGPFELFGLFGNGLWYKSAEERRFSWLNILFGFTVFGSERREENSSQVPCSI